MQHFPGLCIPFSRSMQGADGGLHQQAGAAMVWTVRVQTCCACMRSQGAWTLDHPASLPLLPLPQYNSTLHTASHLCARDHVRVHSSGT